MVSFKYEYFCMEILFCVEIWCTTLHISKIKQRFLPLPRPLKDLKVFTSALLVGKLAIVTRALKLHLNRSSNFVQGTIFEILELK